MALKRPEIDYSASTALRDLISLAAHYVDKDLDRKAKLKAEGLILAKEEYDLANDELRDLKNKHSMMSTKYRSLFGSVPEIESTNSSKVVRENLTDWYTDTEFQINNKKQSYESSMLGMSQDILDIERVKAGLKNISSISPEKGVPDIYDEPDFASGRLEEIFGVDAGLIDKFRAKQKEAIPTAMASLNALLKTAKLEELKRQEESGKQVGTKTATVISSRVYNSRFAKRVRTIAGLDLDPEEMQDMILNIGGEDKEGLLLKRLIAGEFENIDKEGNLIETDKDVIKELEGKQYERILNLFSTIESFKTKEGTKDIMGLGRFVNLLEGHVDRLKPEHREGFKKYIDDYFNIDLDAAGSFLLPGFTLDKEGKKKQSIFDIRDFDNLPSFDMLASFVGESKMGKEKYFEDEQNRKNLRKLYKQKYPKKSEEIVLNTDSPEERASKNEKYNNRIKNKIKEEYSLL